MTAPATTTSHAPETVLHADALRVERRGLPGRR